MILGCPRFLFCTFHIPCAFNFSSRTWTHPLCGAAESGPSAALTSWGSGAWTYTSGSCLQGWLHRLFFNVFCDLSRVKVSPLLPDLNVGKVPRNGSRRSGLGGRHPRNPRLSPGLVPEQRAHLSLQAPGEAAVSSLEGTESELGPARGLWSTSLCSLWSLPLSAPAERELGPARAGGCPRAGQEGCVVLC